MPDLTQLVHVALKGLPSKPEDTATREAKKRYSELMSEALAPAFAEALRARGMTDIRPAGPGEVDAGGGGQLPLAGGLGAKTIDLSWASEQSGLIFAMSIKAISFKDGRSKNFQKNLANRSETMLFEAVTLHKRFPFAVVVGLLVLDAGVEKDGTSRRRSTFHNACTRLRLFTGRTDPAGRDEQLERVYILLVDANRFSPVVRCYRADDSETEISLAAAADEIVELVLERSPDLYEGTASGDIRRRR